MTVFPPNPSLVVLKKFCVQIGLVFLHTRILTQSNWIHNVALVELHCTLASTVAAMWKHLTVLVWSRFLHGLRASFWEKFKGMTTSSNWWFLGEIQAARVRSSHLHSSEVAQDCAHSLFEKKYSPSYCWCMCWCTLWFSAVPCGSHVFSCIYKHMGTAVSCISLWFPKSIKIHIF